MLCTTVAKDIMSKRRVDYQRPGQELQEAKGSELVSCSRQQGFCGLSGPTEKQVKRKEYEENQPSQ